MRNIELRTTNKFGVTNTEKFNGRKLTRFVAKEAAERNISEYQVIRELFKNHFITYYSDKEITSYEFSWRDEFNYKCKNEQIDIEVIDDEIFTRVYREDGKYNYTNAKGEALFNEWFEFVGIFYEGFAIVQREDYLCNFIDKQGNILSDEWFYSVDIFQDGFAVVQRTNGELCKIDKTGKIVIRK